MKFSGQFLDGLGVEEVRIYAFGVLERKYCGKLTFLIYFYSVFFYYFFMASMIAYKTPCGRCGTPPTTDVATVELAMAVPTVAAVAGTAVAVVPAAPTMPGGCSGENESTVYCFPLFITQSFRHPLQIGSHQPLQVVSFHFQCWV